MKSDFWKHTKLEDMTTPEWESLCDRCGLCCLIRLEDEDTSELVQTNIACKYLNLNDCSCGDYKNRTVNVPDCLKVTPEIIPNLHWMPHSCAYRLLSEGRELEDWHPLVSGRLESVHEKGGSSFMGDMISEADIDDIDEYISNIVLDEDTDQ